MGGAERPPARGARTSPGERDRPPRGRRARPDRGQRAAGGRGAAPRPHPGRRLPPRDRAMIRGRVLYQLMRADYLERVRRYAFVVTLGLTAYFAYLAMPPDRARYATLRIGDYRGVYNSEWVGCQVALMTAAFLSLVGFYLVKNAIDRDRLSGVGQILATTPLAKWQYTLGKWASNMAVLTTMVATMSVCAVGMQLLRGEDRAIDPVAIAAPLAFVTLPAMSLTAGLAVLFEALPMTAGGLGNVVFFFVWGFVFAGPDIGSPLHYHGIGSAL